jgi:hypothetical protein
MRLSSVALLVVLLALIGSSVMAQSTEGNVYTGCLTPGGVIESIAIDSSPQKPCGHVATQISWNEIGAEGLQGPPGVGDLGCSTDQIIKWDDVLEQWVCSNDLALLEGRIADLEDLLRNFSRVDNTIYLTGANLQVVNGTGETYTTNGLGNVIIGYNAYRGGNYRSGSHMLVVGNYNSYSGSGGIVAGAMNTTIGDGSSVVGGQSNTAIGYYTSVSGGLTNTASGNFASVSGGAANKANGVLSSVSGGQSNTASGHYASVSGGESNAASGSSSSVSGGWTNEASGYVASVSGGWTNEASGYVASVSGGADNIASHYYASVSGGWTNEASGSFSSVSGGSSNTASGILSSVSGGRQRNAAGQYDWRAGNQFEED